MLASWGVRATGVVRATRMDGRARPGLLGGARGTILTLSNRDSVEDAAHALTGLDAAGVDRLVGSGMVILLRIPATMKASRMIERTAKLVGAGYENPPHDREGEISRILNGCSLRTTVIAGLREYVGDSYDILLPVIASIASEPKEDQRRMTLDDVMIRIPSKPGQVTPWSGGFGESMDELAMSGRTDDAMIKAKRVLDGGMPPVIYAPWFVRRVHMAVVFAAMTGSGATPDEAAHALGLGGPGYTRKRPDPANGLGGWQLHVAQKNISGALAHGASMNSLMALDHRLAILWGMLRGSQSRGSLDGESVVLDMVLSTSVVFSGGRVSAL